MVVYVLPCAHTRPRVPSPHISTLTLAAETVTRVQRYSSYTFTAFLAAHVTNTSLLPLLTQSVPAADTYLLLTRPYYQSPLLEPAVVGLPLALHVGAGLALRLHRRRQALRWYGGDETPGSGEGRRAARRRVAWPRLSGTSALGWGLAPLLAGHVLVNRLVPLWEEGGSSGVGLAFVAHGFAKHPVVANAGYAALVGIGVAHFVRGWATWLGWDVPSAGKGEPEERKRAWKRKRRWWEINGVIVLVAGAWMAGGLGIVGRGGTSIGWVGKGFDRLYRSLPVVGVWM